MEPAESRAAAFRREFYKPESIDDIHGTIESDANTVQQFFELPDRKSCRRPSIGPANSTSTSPTPRPQAT